VGVRGSYPLHRCHDSVGKLSTGHVVAAATCPNEPGVLGLLIDERTSKSYLADSGSVYSLLPHHSSAPATGPSLVTADKKPVACWGECERTLHVGGRTFTWKFLLAAVAFPIVGADFLKQFKLMVDLDKMRLVHNSKGWHVPLAAPPMSSTFAAIGVQLAEAKAAGGEAAGGSPGGQRRSPSVEPTGGSPALRATCGKSKGPPKAATIKPSAPDFAGILKSFPDVLNESKVLPPAKHAVQHVIETEGRPVASKYRRLDPVRLAAAKAEFAELERQGIIRRSSSSWSSPLHMVKKADGTWRPCGDFRRLNLQTVPDRYTCPNMADLTSRLKGCTIFSKLDLRKGYHQVPVDPTSVQKTAIITPFGLFEFLRMPFGLRNSGQTFQRMMDEVMQGLDYTFCYLDDVLVASATPEEHAEHLKEVLERLRGRGLVLNGEKCVLGATEVEYLGHLVSARGIRPLPDRVRAIQDFSQPKSSQQLQSFLGMANFYRRFIPSAAKILKPLTDVLRGGKVAQLAWTAEMETAFNTVKQKLVDAVELAHPNPAAPLFLAVDASDTHVGGVLQQKDSRGALQPLGFFSVKLDSTQARYSTFDRELLACYLAIRHFRWCVEGRPFTLLTDHKPLTFALSRLSDAWSARQQRQLSYVAEYTSDIQHVAGVENVVADTLSRPACAVLPSDGGRISLGELSAAQATCKESQEWRGKAEVQVVAVGDLDLVCDNSTGALRPVVPATWRKKVFLGIHGLAHAGTRATRRMITSRYVWKGCARDITAWCKDCQDCARGKVTQQEHAQVEAIPVPDAAFSHVHVDLVGPLPASVKGHTYLLTMIDRTTRWPEVVPLQNISAQEVADTFVATWVARFGSPNIITTDRGTQFTGSIWNCMCRTLGSRHVTTTAYHPQANGMVERFHRQLKGALRARSGGRDWLDHLPWVLLGLRAAPKEEAGVSSAEATLGIPLQLPGQPLPIQHVREQHAERPVIPSTIRSYAEVTAGRDPGVAAGDLVYVREGQSRGPLAPSYAGPYVALERKGKSVKLQLGTKEEWVAVERLKRHAGAAPVDPALPPARGRPKGRPARAEAEDSL